MFPAYICLARRFYIYEVLIMNNLNSIILEGNLVRDAVLTEPASGFKVAKFTIGVNRFHKNQNGEGIEEVSYFDVEAYNTMAEYCEKKAKKGRGIRVVGRLKQSTWKDESGKLCSRTYVVAEHIEYKPIFHKTEQVQSSETTEQVPVVTPEPVPVEEAVAF